MKAKKIREMSSDEIQNEISKLSELSFKLRVQKVTGQIDNPMKLRLARKDLARLKTELRMREIEKKDSIGAKEDTGLTDSDGGRR